MIKNLIKNTILFSAIMLLNCSSKQDCPEGINLLPMYGEVEKCAEQIKSDNEFISDCDKQFKSRTEAAEKYVEKAWGYFYNNEPETSMKRFNQAWLLDKDNAEIYWGFGNLVGMKHELKQSISLFEKSIKINPNNPKVYESVATSYGQLFFETKKIEYLDLTIKNLKKSLKLDPKNAKNYGSLTSAYAYLTQKDSLKKYLEITDKLDPNMISPEVRKIAAQK
ncbi:hypothetical protein SAMN05444395_1026 [Flavobacterium fryxellicola]|uniref:Uncharacterized protein n=1 Tax=Flavobacterium fryxellicola TaxID=249352 RepID=A0A167YB51_9FLAO|nr:hypothetical protein [Flavobacterium fryxellicola]OAB29203.1 hypothetical protein FBFR_07125 [Flavobacterium fryxellicola]SHN57564.1 hypothetical protein SAMN05444395_1026 [Flavobacterium fryxellicola]